jgi:hypothetical protein
MVLEWLQFVSFCTDFLLSETKLQEFFSSRQCGRQRGYNRMFLLSLFRPKILTHSVPYFCSCLLVRLLITVKNISVKKVSGGENSFWLPVSDVSVHGRLTVVLGTGGTPTAHFIPAEKQKERDIYPQEHAPSNLVPPPHNNAMKLCICQWIDPLIKSEP